MGDYQKFGFDLHGVIVVKGVLDPATVAELRRRDPEATTADLVASGIAIGREHIAATVNTLLLAYAAASMPLLLLFSISDQSLVMVANSEVIAVEIVRTLCGSIGLVAAVPVTTALAAIATSPRGTTGADESDPAPADLQVGVVILFLCFFRKTINKRDSVHVSIESALLHQRVVHVIPTRKFFQTFSNLFT